MAHKTDRPQTRTPKATHTAVAILDVNFRKLPGSSSPLFYLVTNPKCGFIDDSSGKSMSIQCVALALGSVRLVGHFATHCMEMDLPELSSIHLHLGSATRQNSGLDVLGNFPKLM